MNNKEKGYLPIEDYGLIGNLHTTALVSKQGSIDFMPYPRFDDSTLFGSILDKEIGGFFSVTIKGQEVNHKQLYLPDTAVLLTRFLANNGIAELTDFMPLEENEGKFVLVRKLKVIKGKHTFKIEVKPRFNYGKETFKLKKDGEDLIIYNENSDTKDVLRLMSSIKFQHKNESLIAEIEMESKDELVFVLLTEEATKKEVDSRNKEYFASDSFDETVLFWRNWSSISTYSGRWKNIVSRSAITLKLLSSHRFGSTVAAATLGLPEVIGGERNWDYRFCWIRDSAFTMYNFLQLGYAKEAQKFIKWIQQRTLEIETANELKLMYRVDGLSDLEEKEISYLKGYKNSKPVRIGNGAYNQFQLDIYGELIDTIYIYNTNAEPISYAFWQTVIKLIDFVAENWKEKDRGIWEVRDEKKEFLISKVMCWVALDRGILIAENRSFPAPLEHWRKIRDKIYNDVFNNFWNEKKQAFVQYRGGTTLDASALLIPLVRMLSPKEPRWVSTLKAIEEELITDSLVYRYKIDDGASDGFSDEESTFSMCSFWYIECLAKAGDTDKAILYFEKMLGYSNHLGLFSEQISVKGELVGNFPQAFTHLGLISAARRLKILIDKDNFSNKK